MGDSFSDVVRANPFYRFVETRGGGNYCPLAPVTRDQMGVFISKTFGLALYGP